MSYKFRNIFGLTALTLILGLSEVNMVHAQGVVMLSENATDEDPALKDIPVIIFSSLINEDMRRKGEMLGADAQLSKSQMSEFIQAVDSFLQ